MTALTVEMFRISSFTWTWKLEVDGKTAAVFIVLVSYDLHASSYQEKDALLFFPPDDRKSAFIEKEEQKEGKKQGKDSGKSFPWMQKGFFLEWRSALKRMQKSVATCKESQRMIQ